MLNEQFSRDSSTDFRKSLRQSKAVKPIISKLGINTTAYIFSALSSICWVLGFIYCNQNNFNFVQTSLVRGISTVLLYGAIVKLLGFSIQYKSPSNFRYLFITNLAFIIRGLVFGLVQFFLPLPIVHTISCAGSIFVFLVDYFINGVKISRIQLIGITIVIIGLMFVVNGLAIIHIINPQYQSKTSFENYASNDPFVCSFMAVLQILSMLIWSIGCVLIKKIKGLNGIQINFNFGIMTLFLSALLYPNFTLEPVPLAKIIISIPLSGFLLALATLLAFIAYSMAQNSGKVTMVGFISVIVGYLISVVRYHQPLNPVCLVGAFLIILGVRKVIT